MWGYIAVFAFIIALVLLAWFLRTRDRLGYWDKEGHGSPDHPAPGVHYRPLEAPPKEHFD